jgi:hypothetical protein
MAKRTKRQDRPTIAITLEALRKGAEDHNPAAILFYGLSGLSELELAKIKPIWTELTDEYRKKLMQRLAETSETDFEMDYHAIGMMGLDDALPEIRQAAIEILWEDESLELMQKLMLLAQLDPSIEVRAAALTGLGRFILLGELGDLPEAEIIPAQNVAIKILKDEFVDVDIRRRALEAISNSSHEILPGAIQRAYRSSEHRMKVSSVFAMGRSYDERWGDIVLRELESEHDELRYEAARAAGELELDEAVPLLARLLADEDREIKEVSIWSLGEIGGREALRILNAILEVAEEAEDEDLIEAIEDAIGTASFASGDIFPTLDPHNLN